MKRCCHCKTEKPLFQFPRNASKKDGYANQCKACKAKHNTTIKGKSSRLLSGCISRVKDTQALVTITREWIEARLSTGKCELTGLPFSFQGRGAFTRQPYAPSIDRKDPFDQNYTPENCRVVLWAVNCTFAEYGEDIMLPILKEIINAKTTKLTPIPESNHRAG